MSEPQISSDSLTVFAAVALFALQNNDAVNVRYVRSVKPLLRARRVRLVEAEGSNRLIRRIVDASRPVVCPRFQDTARDELSDCDAPDLPRFIENPRQTVGERGIK